ncbi:hypothetical protein ZWY2020_016706 [Hordeum vulgare]|nr:hypothetical protein ZWY2020_016706 [Hordeum vulgare]
MEGFFNLISYFQMQSEQAFCSLASLSIMLNVLAIDPGRLWKGPWRWANDVCKDGKRQMINTEDVFKALDEIGFREFVEPVRTVLEDQCCSYLYPPFCYSLLLLLGCARQAYVL